MLVGFYGAVSTSFLGMTSTHSMEAVTLTVGRLNRSTWKYF